MPVIVVWAQLLGSYTQETACLLAMASGKLSSTMTCLHPKIGDKIFP